MSGVTPSSTSRGLVICTGVYLALASLYSAIYSPPAWMWFGWSVMAIATVILIVTDR
ncbi:hypothetical protein [Streptodolium elevatio]|uniref:Uncharacterized protein n=1 Tax=Streptodolium elevatio TaxID=3157996 RepID=A0ABV3DJ24_9ACTN